MPADNDLSDRCTRCGHQLLAGGGDPLVDLQGRPFIAELCETCDAERPAAAAFIRCIRAGAGAPRGPWDPGLEAEARRMRAEWNRAWAAELARLSRAWIAETITEHSYPRTLRPPAK